MAKTEPLSMFISRGAKVAWSPPDLFKNRFGRSLPGLAYMLLYGMSDAAWR